MASELESDLQDTVDWCRPVEWLIEFNVEKTQLVSFDQSKDTGAIDVKMNGSVVTATGLEPRTTYFLNEHSNIWPNVECSFKN